MTWLLGILKGWMWKIAAGFAALSAFLFMLLRLRSAQREAEKARRKAGELEQAAKQSERTGTARRKARTEAERVEEFLARRRNPEPGDSFGDPRLRTPPDED